MEKMCNNEQWGVYCNVVGMIPAGWDWCHWRVHLKIEVNAKFWLWNLIVRWQGVVLRLISVWILSECGPLVVDFYQHDDKPYVANDAVFTFSWLINCHLFKENWRVFNEVDENILHHNPCPWSVLSTYCVCHQRTGSCALPANLSEHITIPALKYVYCIMLSLPLIFKQGTCFLIMYRRMLLVFRCTNINYKNTLNP
jgi:hypothetical protein